MIDQTHSIGSGEQNVPTPLRERIRLENVEISASEAQAFLEWQQIPCKVEFREPLARRMGTAWHDRRLIKLYRHSVWTFLHELAHIVAPEGEHHGPTFGLVLHALYLEWLKLEG